MKRGDIVLCIFPHASRQRSKARPALVVQSDFYNQRISNLLVAGITSTMTNAGDAAHCLVDIASPEGQHSGLTQNSLISCINLAAVPPRNVHKKIGELSIRAMKDVDACLKAALGIP